MLKKIQRRASRINFLQKKIIIVIEIEKCEWIDYDENFYSNNHNNNQAPLGGSLSNLTPAPSTSSIPSSSGTPVSSPLNSPPSSQNPPHALSPQGQAALNALYNHALAPFYPLSIPIGSMMSLSIDKSGKYFSTTDQELTLHSSMFTMDNPLYNRDSKEIIPKLATIQWNHEIIECNGTLYYNPKIHRFQEKFLTINLKMKKRQEKDKEKEKEKENHHNHLHNSLFSVVTSLAGRDHICYTVGRFSVPLHEIIHEQLIANNTSFEAHSQSHPSLHYRPSITSDHVMLSSASLEFDKRRSQSSNVLFPADTVEDEGDSDEAVGPQNDVSDTEDMENESLLEGVYESLRSSFATNRTAPTSRRASNNDFNTKEVKSITITSWNDIEKRIRISLTEQPNIILHGRILIKFLSDPTTADHHASSHLNKIDNYLPKFMLLRQADSSDHEDENDYEEKERKKREKERERERERETGGGGVYQILDEDHLFDHHHEHDEDDSDDDGYDHLSTISSLTSSTSPHGARRKRLITDIFTGIPGSNSSSFLHSQKLSASFPTQFFKKVKERLHTPRSSNNAPPAVLEKHISLESNNSSDSSQYGPTSYPQPSIKSNIGSTQKIRKPSVIMSDEAQRRSQSHRSLSPILNKEITQENERKEESSLSSIINPREKMTKVWVSLLTLLSFFL